MNHITDIPDIESASIAEQGSPLQTNRTSAVLLEHQFDEMGACQEPSSSTESASVSLASTKKLEKYSVGPHTVASYSARKRLVSKKGAKGRGPSEATGKKAAPSPLTSKQIKKETASTSTDIESTPPHEAASGDAPAERKANPAATSSPVRPMRQSRKRNVDVGVSGKLIIHLSDYIYYIYTGQN